jgi:hypothetical protein
MCVFVTMIPRLRERQLFRQNHNLFVRVYIRQHLTYHVLQCMTLLDSTMLKIAVSTYVLYCEHNTQPCSIDTCARQCDNVLIMPLDPSVSDDDILDHGDATVPNFEIVLADFGESKIYGAGEHGYTTRNRGTEYVKSPEMLMVANASSKEKATYDRYAQLRACFADARAYLTATFSKDISISVRMCVYIHK